MLVWRYQSVTQSVENSKFCSKFLKTFWIDLKACLVPILPHCHLRKLSWFFGLYYFVGLGYSFWVLSRLWTTIVHDAKAEAKYLTYGMGTACIHCWVICTYNTQLCTKILKSHNTVTWQGWGNGILQVRYEFIALWYVSLVLLNL